MSREPPGDPFVAWPHSVLRRPAEPVGPGGAVDERARALWERLVGPIRGRLGLVGLAAPQIGEAVRLAVVDCSEARDAPLLMADPEILDASPETGRHREGSPNLPGVLAEIERPVAVRVGFLDARGMRVERDLDGLWARSAQHQIDHLEGRMFFDRLSRLKRERLLAAHAKKARRA